MCLTRPYQIVSTKGKKFIVEEFGKKKELAGSLVKARVGDYVILQNNFIVRKISKKSANKIINLLKK